MLKIWVIFINALIVASIIQLLGEYHVISFSFTHEQNVKIDLIIASIFAVDYVARFYASPKRLKFFINPFNLIDLLAIIPSFIGLGQAKALRSLRIFRALRFLRIVKLIKSLDITDDYQKENKIDEELDYYNKLLAFYNNFSINVDATSNTSTIKTQTKQLIKSIESKITATNQAEKQVFLLSFIELLGQVSAVLIKIEPNHSNLQLQKLKYLVNEIELLLKSENTKEKIIGLKNEKPSMHLQFARLVRLSLKDILSTFFAAIVINILISYSPIHKMIEPGLAQLSFIEGAMAALIVFITSFNMSYTNSKRATTDLAVIDFFNTLVIYSEQINLSIRNWEKTPDLKNKLLNQVDDYFGFIGLDVLNGVKKGNPYQLKFDTTIVECIDRMNTLVSPYFAKENDVSKNRISEIREQLISQLNKFQTLSTIRTAIIFNALNHWIIRITYFVLTSLSPFSALPRLFIVNLMQRAFYKTANETDNAIYNISLASLPIEDRVLRRLCRISGVLHENKV